MKTDGTARLRPPYSVLLTLSCAVCILSWSSSDLTVNEFHHFGDLRLTAAFFVLLSGLAIAYAALSDTDRRVGVRVLSFGFLGLSLPYVLSFPVGAKDVFLYAFYGKMWSGYDLNPYLHPPAALAGDDWFAYLRGTWFKDYPAAYGPLFLEQARLMHSLFGASLMRVVAGYKLLNLLLVGLTGWVVVRIRRELGETADEHGCLRALMLWLWCPLVLFESLGSGHNDLLAVLLIASATLAWLRDRWQIGVALLTCAFWYKWYAAVLVPVWCVWTLRRWGLASAARRTLTAAAVVAAVTAAALVSVSGAIPDMLARTATFQNVRMIAPTELPPPLWAGFQLARAAGLFRLEDGQAMFDAARLLLFVAGIAFVLWRRRGCEYRPVWFIEDLLWALLLFFGLVVTILWPWHLIPLGALALASGEPRLERLWTFIHAVALLSYFLTFAYALLAWALVGVALEVRSALRGEPSKYFVR